MLMEPKNFVIWLSGFLEACENKLNEDQTKIVKDKLNNLFHHEAETINEPSINQNWSNYDSPSEEGVMRC